LPLLYTHFDAVVSSYLGETASNIRKVFEYASRGSWVVFFDEFDAIGKSRDDPTEHGELKRVVNSFLQLLDGFHSESIVIAATNHEALLDSALWRRFDEVIFFGPPSREQIEPLLELKLRPLRHSNVKLSRFVPKLAGLTHADVERICRDAMKTCLMDGEANLSSEALSGAIERQRRRLAIIESGAPRRSGLVDE
jgi:SpoVK/Ycf46/Vps4 family AAA+-type ATPase